MDPLIGGVSTHPTSSSPHYLYLQHPLAPIQHMHAPDRYTVLHARTRTVVMPRIRVHRTRGLVHPAATNSRIKATKCFISSLRGCANEPSALIDNTRLCCDGRCRRTFLFSSDRRSSPPTARRYQASKKDQLFTSRPATAACSLLRALLLRLRLLVQAQVCVRPLRP